MSGCLVPDRLLTGWERHIVELYTVPSWRGRTLVWNLDELPACAIKALCWPRASVQAPHALAVTGTE